jgi:uncharacterized membrane protein
MFENLFSPSPQVWTGMIAAAVAVPILIHLINLMRHKKVEWAAMEFLLRSHRKNRSWVWLKQFLLLLSRIALLLLALFMFAQVGCENDRVARLLGGRSTHHYVLLDDSFSMGQRDIRGRAFDRAVGMLSKIAARARNRQNQVFSLVTFSSGGANEANAILDSLAVDTNFDQTIETTKGQLSLGASAAEVGAPLDRVAALVAERKDENAIVYVISDFCERNWKQPEQVVATIQELERQGAAVELIDCSESSNENLAVTRLAVTGNVRAAQTPLMMEVAVKNYSNSIVNKVEVELESAEYPKVGRTSKPLDIIAETKQLPTVFFDSIEPGETATQAFPVFFNQPGEHVVVGKLENDLLEIDNKRYCQIGIKDSSRVLLVGQGEKSASRFFSIVLNPGGNTGISTELADDSYLRDRSADDLDAFDTIFLFDIGKLGEQETSNLEGYVERGGGVVFFLGPNANTSFYSERLYRGGQGVFPMPLDRVMEVVEQPSANVADLQPSQHPVFAPANSVKNSLLDLVQIEQVVTPPLEWKAVTDPTVEVLATVRGSDKQPLVVSKRFGQGTSVVLTTTADSRWNNWMRNATYLPIMLLLQDYVASGRFSNRDRLVGESIDYRLEKKLFRRETTLVTGDIDQREAIALMLDQSDGDAFFSSTIPADQPGVYEFWAQRADGTVDVTRPVVNVDTVESDLTPAKREDLLSRMGGSAVNLVDWDQFNPEPKIKPASLLNRLLFCLLIFVLVAEQTLAYATNYHR